MAFTDDQNRINTGITTLSDAEIGALKPIRVQGQTVVQSDAGVQGAFRKDAEDAFIRQLEDEENAKEGRFAGEPTWTHRDQLEYSRLESAGRLFLEHPDEHDDNEFGGLLDTLNRRRFGIPTQLMTAFDRPGDEHGNQARLREFFAFTDRLNAVNDPDPNKRRDQQLAIIEEQLRNALPEYSAWMDAKQGADGGAAWARSYLERVGRDWSDEAKSFLDKWNPNAWLDYATDPSGNTPKPSSDITDAQAIAETEKKFANDRVLMGAAKIVPFLTKTQREFVNLAAHGASQRTLEGILSAMDPNGRDFMRSLAQAVRPAHEDIPWVPDEGILRAWRSTSGALRGFGRFSKMAGVYLGGLGSVSGDWYNPASWRLHHLSPGTVERMNEMRKDFEEDIKNYEALGEIKFGDASDFAEKAVNGFFDSAPMQASTLAGVLLRRGGAALSKSGQKWGAVAEGAGWALQGYVAVSMIGEHFDNLVLNGVDMEHAVPLSFYGGVADTLVENWNVDQWLGAKLSAEEARYVGWRAAFRVMRRHSLKDLGMMMKSNLKQTVLVTMSELGEEIVQGLNKRGVLSVAEGRNIIEAYTNSEAGQAMADSLVEALPTCFAFGLVSSVDLTGQARKGGIATYQDNLDQIAREVAKREGADTLDIEVRNRYVAQVKNTGDDIFRATQGMNSRQRAAWLANSDLKLTPAEQAFYADHCAFYDALAAQDGALYASAIAGGSLNEALLAKEGWKFEHDTNTGAITRIISPDGKVNEAMHVFNRSATIDDLDDAMVHDFIAEWNENIAEDPAFADETPFAEVGTETAKADIANWGEAERKRLESVISTRMPGFFNSDGITLFLGTGKKVSLIGERKVIDAEGEHMADEEVGETTVYRSEGDLSHEVLHAFVKKLEQAATRDARRKLRGLAVSLGRNYNEAAAAKAGAMGIVDAMKAIENAEPEKVDWKAVAHNFGEGVKRVLTLGLSRGDMQQAFRDGSTRGVDPTEYFKRILGQGMLDLKELQERQKADKEEHKKLVEKILAERVAKRQRKIGMRAAERAAQERADRAAAESEARRIEGERRAAEARAAAEARERERREMRFFLNRQSNTMPRLTVAPHLIGSNADADAETASRSIPAYRILWKVAKGQNLTDSEKNTLGDVYGLPVEALTHPESFSDADMARLQDGLTRLWTDASNARIVVPTVYVTTEADTHRILPNEVYDPVFQVFRNGEIVVDPTRAEPFTPATAPGSAQERAVDAPYVTDEEAPAPASPSVPAGSTAPSAPIPAAQRAPVGNRNVQPAPREDAFEFRRGANIVRLVGGLWNWLHKPFDYKNESPQPSKQDASGHGLWNGRSLPEKVSQALVAWKDHCPRYMGNKNKMLDRVVKAICNNFTAAERNAYTHLNDCFGGGGCWGLSIAMTVFPNVKSIIVNEFEEGRIEKIRLLHTLDGQMEQKLRDFLARRNVLAKTAARMNDIRSTGRAFSPNGMNTRQGCYETMEDEITHMSPEDKGLLFALLDNLQSRMQWGEHDASGVNSFDAIIESAIKGVGKDAVKATELANAFKERGGEIIYSAGDAKQQADYGTRLDTDGVYRLGASGEPLAVPHGANVMSVTDPPYYRTEGYGNHGERVKVGLDADPQGWGYADTKAMLDTLVDLHDGIVYTDEAWWFKPEYRFDESKIGKEEQILGGIVNDFDHFDVAGGVAGRQETLGIQHGRTQHEVDGEAVNGPHDGHDDDTQGHDDGRGVPDVLGAAVPVVAGNAQGENANTPRSDDRGGGPRVWDGDAATLADAVADGWEIPRRLRGYANRLLEEARTAQMSHEAQSTADLMAVTHFSINSGYADRTKYTDGVLEHNATEGDLYAVAEWFDRRWKSLVHKAQTSARGITEPEAEEIVSNVRALACERYGTDDLRPNYSFGAFVYGAIRISGLNTSTRQSNGLGTREMLTLDRELTDGEEGETFLDRTVDTRTVRPGEMSAADSARQRVDEYLSHFNAEKRAIYEERMLDGKSANDVASAHGITTGDVISLCDEITNEIRSGEYANHTAETDRPLRTRASEARRVVEYFRKNPYASTRKAAEDLGLMVEGGESRPEHQVTALMSYAEHTLGLKNPRLLRTGNRTEADMEAAGEEVQPKPAWQMTPAIKAVSDLASEGLYADEIAARLGISRAAVWSRVQNAHANGVEIEVKKRPNGGEARRSGELNELEKNITDLAELGLTRREIADRLGITVSKLGVYAKTARRKGWQGSFVDDAKLRSDVTHFAIMGKRAREEARAMIEKYRPTLGHAYWQIDRQNDSIHEMLVKQAVDDIASFDTPKERKAALYWFCKSTVRLPEDVPLISEAILTAERAHVDPFQFERPGEIVDKFNEYRPVAKPIAPDTVPELSDKRVLSNGIVTYLVQDDRAGQAAMRRILNTHLGKDEHGDYRSPWCLLYSNGRGGCSAQSWHYWHDVYNELPKRVAFKDGKVCAFMATDESSTWKGVTTEEWWDLEDSAFEGIPYTETDAEERTLEKELLADGTVRTLSIRRGVPGAANGTYEEWFDDGSYSKWVRENDTPVEERKENGAGVVTWEMVMRPGSGIEFGIEREYDGKTHTAMAASRKFGIEFDAAYYGDRHDARLRVRETPYDLTISRAESATYARALYNAFAADDQKAVDRIVAELTRGGNRWQNTYPAEYAEYQQWAAGVQNPLDFANWMVAVKDRSVDTGDETHFAIRIEPKEYALLASEVTRNDAKFYALGFNPPDFGAAHTFDWGYTYRRFADGRFAVVGRWLLSRKRAKMYWNKQEEFNNEINALRARAGAPDGEMRSGEGHGVDDVHGNVPLAPGHIEYDSFRQRVRERTLNPADGATSSVGVPADTRHVPAPMVRENGSTHFSIAPRSAENALKYYLAREIMENGGRLPDTRHAKHIARSFGIAGDISPHINAAMAEAATQTRVLRYIASDPKVERAIADAGQSARYEAEIKRARQVQLKWSQDVSEGQAHAKQAVERAVRAIRGEDYERMVTREGIDLNAILLALRPDEKPPKAHVRGSADAASAASSAPDAASEAHGKALAEQVIERAKALVEEAKAAVRSREEERATRHDAQNGAEAAQEPAQAADDAETDEDADPNANAVAAAYRRAIRESGITLDNPAEVVQLVEAITKKYILDNPGEVSDLDPSDVWASPIARAMFAGNLASFAQSVAAAYSPSHARIRVAKKAQMLNGHGVNTLGRIEQIGESVFRDLNKDIIRQTRQSLIKDIRKIAANPGRHFTEREEAHDRKVSADVSRYCKFVTWALNVPAAKVEETMNELEDFLNGYGSDLSEAQKNRYKDFYEAQLKRQLLDQFGNLRARMPAELAEIRDRLAQKVDEGTFDAMCFSERWEEARNAGVEAAVPGIVADPSHKGVQPEPSFWKDYLYSLVGMWETKWRQLTRFCRDDAARTRSLSAMSRVEEMIQASEDAQFNYLQEQKAKLRDLIGNTYGSEKEARKALSAEVDPALWHSLDKGDQHTEWTVGRLLQMYVSCVQPDYSENCAKYGRDAAYVAHLEEAIRALDPRHFALIQGLRELYLEQGDALSDVMERTSGTRLYTPNRLYMPVQPLRTHNIGKRGEGRGYTPFAASLTPRVKHGLDFDQTCDILELFLDRAEDAAHTIGWADSGSMVLGICQSDRVLNAIRTAFGSRVMSQWNSYVLDILAGTKNTPAGDESAPMRVLARYASRLWIGLNPVSWTKQIMSFPCFALSLDGTLKDVVCSGAFWTLHPLEAFRCARDLARTRAFTARYGIAISQELRYATSSEGAFKTWWQKAMDTAMGGVYALDKFTVYLQAGIYRRRRAQLEKNGMEAHEASETAASWLMHIVDKTAQTARTLNTTQLQRAGGAWAFMLQFKSAPAQQSQFEITAAQEVAAKPGDLKRWKKFAAVIAINHIIVPAMNTIIESAFAALVQGGMPDEDKRKRQLATLLANMLSGSLGSIVFIGLLVEGAASALMDKVVLDRKPSMYNFSRQQIPALSVIGNAFGSYNRFAEALENMQWTDVTDTVIDMATAIGGVIPGISWASRTIDKARKAREER